jgi:phage-related protein
MAQAPDKPLAWLHGEIKTPPFSPTGRLEAGALLRRLQRGEAFGLPHSRPMPAVGEQCHELRIVDAEHAWRSIYHVALDAVVILEVFSKKTQQTPDQALATCRRRLGAYRKAVRHQGGKR